MNKPKRFSVGDWMLVKLDGLTVQAKIRKVGAPQGLFRMLTLDVDGKAVYAVAHESEVM